MIDLTCTTCHEVFQRKESVHRKNLRRGTRQFYCSYSCNPHSADRNNDLMPFTYLMSSLRKTGRAEVIDVDNVFLKELYEKQKGLCALTGIEMDITKTKSTGGPASPYQVSVDRIKNDKGYSKDNVRLTCLITNLSRNIFSDEEVMDFCKEAAKDIFTDWDLINSLLNRGYIIGRNK